MTLTQPRNGNRTPTHFVGADMGGLPPVSVHCTCGVKVAALGYALAPPTSGRRLTLLCESAAQGRGSISGVRVRFSSDGRVRIVHEGGKRHPCGKRYSYTEKQLEQLFIDAYASLAAAPLYDYVDGEYYGPDFDYSGLRELPIPSRKVYL